MFFQVDAWAQSNTIPGLFTGSTGAQVLSSEELSNSGPQAWLKKVTYCQNLEQETRVLLKSAYFFIYYVYDSLSNKSCRYTAIIAAPAHLGGKLFHWHIAGSGARAVAASLPNSLM